jgi:uncharacterized membrane protein
VVTIIPTEPVNKTTSEKNITFRWTHIALPAAVLLISVILTACFYGLLPPEVAYHFEDGSPDQWMSRGAIIAWLVIPQFVLVILGLAISGGSAILGTRFVQTEKDPLSKVLLIMGNMVVLPQIILAFAMLDIFLYNAYRIHLMPLWIFALVVLVLGGIVLGIFFIQALRPFRGLPDKSP